MYQDTLPQIFLILIVENALLGVLAIIMGNLLLKFSGYLMIKPVASEWIFFFRTILVNTFITYVGFYFWISGIVSVDMSPDWIIPFQVLFLFFLMDFLMYLLHRLLHKGWFFNFIHRIHHKNGNLKPIHLFRKHPFELLLYGVLWLAVLKLFTFNIYAIIIYIVLHVIIGIVGHLGIHPVPSQIKERKLSNLLWYATFHFDHHQHPDRNFGFYTTIWDKLFKTYLGK